MPPSNGVLGIDLAAGAKKTYACTLDEAGEKLVARVAGGCGDAELLALGAGRRKVAIDAPFGWPRAFVDALEGHRRFDRWPAPDDGPPETFRASLSFRATDRVVMHTRRPLSVSTDKLGVTAMRCAHLLQRFAGSAKVNRAGTGRFVEVYPAGSLTRWGLEASGYKGAEKRPLELLVEEIRAALPQLELSDEDRRLCESTDDALDALVAALTARAALLGLTDPPPRPMRELAAEEGWIHLPVRGSLPLLARTKGTLRSSPQAALAGRLGGVDAAGYGRGVEDVLLPSFSPELRQTILGQLRGKRGSELRRRGSSGKPKFLAAYSSSCLAANVFGPWLEREEGVPFGDLGRLSGERELEAECPTGLSGTPPTLDFLIAGERVLAIESKCTEPFDVHRASFEKSYEPVVARVAHASWRLEYERLRGPPSLPVSRRGAARQALPRAEVPLRTGGRRARVRVLGAVGRGRRRRVPGPSG
ncbi:MAG TPA: DUF429 domain-containing protein [Solirubrobacteraceae bacterium]